MALAMMSKAVAFLFNVVSFIANHFTRVWTTMEMAGQMYRSWVALTARLPIMLIALLKTMEAATRLFWAAHCHLHAISTKRQIDLNTTLASSGPAMKAVRM